MPVSRYPLLGLRGAAPDQRHEGGRALQDRTRHKLQKVSVLCLKCYLINWTFKYLQGRGELVSGQADGS